MSERTIHGDYLVVGRDANGREILRERVEDTGTLTITDLTQTVADGVDELLIVPEAIAVRDGGKTEVRVESDWGALADE